MIIPYPAGLTFDEWSSYLVEQFADIGLAESEIPEEESWRQWGRRAREFDALSEIPDPEQFDGWRAWGERVVEALAPA